MWRRMLWAVLAPLVAAALLLLHSGERATGEATVVTELRVGYVASLLNAPVIVGLVEGHFQQALDDVRIDVHVFGAGPALMEALFAGAIDIAYVGPSPAINAFIRSGGQALRIVAGSAVGGSGFVVTDRWAPGEAENYRGRRIATPQIGNTQDVSLRFHLQSLGVAHGPGEGAVHIVSVGGPELLSLFVRDAVDGAWVPEPWLTRLLASGGGTLYIHEDELATAYVAVRPQLLSRAPELVEAWLRVHIALSNLLNRNEDEIVASVANALSEVWQQAVSEDEVREALQRLRFDWRVAEADIQALADKAYAVGLLSAARPDVGGIVDDGPLARALASIGRGEGGRTTWEP